MTSEFTADYLLRHVLACLAACLHCHVQISFHYSIINVFPISVHFVAFIVLQN